MTSRLAARRNRTAGVLLAPFSVLFVAVFVIPIGYAGYQSFFRQQRSGLGLGPPRTVFAGLGNYARVFADNAFVGGVGRVVAFGVVQVPVMLGLALLLALLLDSRACGSRRFFRLAYFLPYAVPGVIAAIMWSFLYSPGSARWSALARSAGARPRLPVRAHVLWSIGNIVTWAWTGYNMLIIYSALQADPAGALRGRPGRRLLRAGRIAWHIKIPLLRPALMLTGGVLDHRHAAAVRRADGAPADRRRRSAARYTP